MQWAASAASTAGVFFGQGPSSKVNTTSPGRRKSCSLKCSNPNCGPPVVSISTTRETPNAFGLPGQEEAADAGLAGWAAAAAGSGAVAGPAGRAGAACAMTCGAPTPALSVAPAVDGAFESSIRVVTARGGSAGAAGNEAPTGSEVFGE